MKNEKMVKTHFVKGEILKNSLISKMDFYTNMFAVNSNDTIHIQADGKQFAFTDVIKYRMNEVNENGEVIGEKTLIKLFDRATLSVYYTMSAGICSQFEAMGAPSDSNCRIVAQAVTKSFKSKEGEERKTLALNIISSEFYEASLLKKECEHDLPFSEKPLEIESKSND